MDEHPLRTWRQREGLSLDDIVARLREAGRSTSAGYLEQIEGGHRRPSWDYASDLSSVTDGEIAPEDFLRWHSDRAECA